MISLQFVKMHGLGNDFVVIDGINQQVQLNTSTIKQMADRHTGIGFDQLLLIEKSKVADFFCRIFNADGSEAEQCGNGMRCVARFLQEKQLTDKKSFRIETKTRTIAVTIHDYDAIEVNMGIPVFESQDSVSITISSQPVLNLFVVSMGNPHAILFVDSLNYDAIRDIGPVIATHEIFPQGTNVGFVEIIDQHHIRLRTYERGVGETLACGSNACAAVAAGIIHHKLANKVTVELPLGQLTVAWEGYDHPVIMTGPASWVYSGVI